MPSKILTLVGAFQIAVDDFSSSSLALFLMAKWGILFGGVIKDLPMAVSCIEVLLGYLFHP